MSSPTPNIRQLLAHHSGTEADHATPGLAAAPSLKVAVVTCMDARIDPYRLLGLEPGNAHVIRNAGGVVTDDVLRSLVLSQRALGTEEIFVIHHTRCGLQGMDEQSFLQDLADEVGTKPAWAIDSFADAATDVAHSIRRIELCPFLSCVDKIVGCVYDVETGQLQLVEAPAGS